MKRNKEEKYKETHCANCFQLWKNCKCKLPKYMRFQLNGKYQYCPNGNYWEEVSGIFDTKLYLFCDCNKCNGQVYELKPFNITKKVDKKQIEKFKKRIKLEEIRFKINIDNMEQVERIIK